MRNRLRPALVILLGLAAWLGSVSSMRRLVAAEPPAAETAAPQLGRRQSELAEKYQRLEMLMLKMAEFHADTDPRRAALLKQALTKSKDRQISPQMQALVELLNQRNLKEAVAEQAGIRTELAQILELLLSEDRADRLKDEQTRIKSYIKEVERLIRQQRGILGRTESGDDPQRLSQEQANTADKAQRLATDIEQNEKPVGSPNSDSDNDNNPADDSNPGEEKSTDDGKPTSSDAKDGQNGGQDGQPANDAPQDDSSQHNRGDEQSDSEKNSSDTNENKPNSADPQGAEPSDGKPSDGKPSDGKPSDGKPSDGQPAEGQPSQGEPSGGESSDSQSPQSPQQPQQQPEAFPGQRRIQAAEQKMREAQERLETAKQSDALEPQREAQRLLEEAKAELEEILRQMREEEIERTLAMLETRFRKMLEMQVKVFEDTQQLQTQTGPERAAQVVVQSGKLSVEERKILAEADKAALLLQEEGSSVAFPEAIGQLQDDMETVAVRLSEAKVDILTITVEQDIITALEEVIAALQKAQQDAEKRRQQPGQQPGQMSPQDMPLVDAIAELKMIRTLQMRVNKRTQTFAKLLSDPENLVGQATDPSLIDSLRTLAEREDRIREITRDILLEKNK